MNAVNINPSFLSAQRVIFELIKYGIDEFYICAGKRNTPLVEVLCALPGVKVFSHFEERSIAFYALGRIKSIHKPVAVIVTSGTAVGELLPATMEAYYTNLPLVLLTADRPRSYRGSGAPQAAELKNIFGIYTPQSFDIEGNETFSLSQVKFASPIHINLCLDEPLVSNVLPTLSFEGIEKVQDIFHDIGDLQTPQAASTLKNFVDNHKNIIVIVGKLEEKFSNSVIHFLRTLQAPVYVEACSHLCSSNEIADIKLNSFDKIWKNTHESQYKIDGVIRIGGVPTHRFWRDLEETYTEVAVLSISSVSFSGCTRGQLIHDVAYQVLREFKLNHNKIEDSQKENLLQSARKREKQIKDLLEKYPHSEQALTAALSEKIPSASRVYLGNSLPIRYWDSFARLQNKHFSFETSRGLSGIDGQISTFLGFSEEGHENWGVVGDLTALYDFPGFWMLEQRKNLKINLVIINNSGGKIFQKLLKGKAGELMQNLHHLDFAPWGDFWGISYEKWQNIPENLNCDKSRIIEIIPDEKETESFNKEFALI